MVTDDNYIHLGEHFAMYIKVELLCCTHEPNIMSTILQ